MSSNRTIIPGAENSFTDNHDYAGGNSTMTPQSPMMPDTASRFNVEQRNEPIVQKPIVGFLYSISRTGVGEYWPLHIGPNSIGRSSDCDVCLQEGTVSSHHANLVVRVMKNPEKVIASICDSSSTIGTMINGESLGFEQRECFNGDIITIGSHYDLLFMLIDARQIGLKTNPEFIPTQAEGSQRQSDRNMGGTTVSDPVSDFPGSNPYAPPVDASQKRTRGYDDSGIQQGHTVTLPGGIPQPPEGQNSGSSGGRTIFM